ncbi:MAG: hypothetical protein AB1486_11600 [Planctomycetota bacterium]
MSQRSLQTSSTLSCFASAACLMTCWLVAGVDSASAQGTGWFQRWPGRQDNVVQVACGQLTSYAVLDTGEVRAWGTNTSGQIGDGTKEHRLTPVQVQELANAVQVAAGERHALAVTDDGKVYAWGSNKSWQLGHGTFAEHLTPIQVPGIDTAVAVAAGDMHSLALLADGTVLGWGNNDFGQLGDGTTVSRFWPAPVLDLSGVVTLEAGYFHNVARLDTGQVKAWGYNSVGQLGNGTFGGVFTLPGYVLGPLGGPGYLTDVVQLSGGGLHNLAQVSNGTVYAWGANAHGQLGDGSYKKKPYPVPVNTSTGFDNAVLIEAGCVHSIGVGANFELYVWGWNGFGQLGLPWHGYWDHEPLPVFHNLLTRLQITGVAGASMHTMLVDSSGHLWGMGNNNTGRLGDGTGDEIPIRDHPVQTYGF